MDWKELRERLESLVYPAEDGEDERKWVDVFHVDCIELGPTALANALVMMQPDTAADCNHHDDFEIDKNSRRHDDLHRVYNTLIWMSLRNSKMLFPVRVVLQRDLLVPNTICGCEDDFGRIVRKDYGRKLLDHFLKAHPSSDWVLQ